MFGTLEIQLSRGWGCDPINRVKPLDFRHMSWHFLFLYSMSWEAIVDIGGIHDRLYLYFLFL